MCFIAQLNGRFSLVNISDNFVGLVVYNKQSTIYIHIASSEK